MTLRLLSAVSCAAIAVLSAQSAFATVFDWSYTVGGVTASGTLSAIADPTATIPDMADPNNTNNDITVAVGAYEVLSIQGTRGGVKITGLDPTDFGGNADDLIFTSVANIYGVDAVVDWNGFAYTTSDGSSYNLYYFPYTTGKWACGDGASYCEAGPTVTPIQALLASNVSISATVPEPRAWALMLVGFAGLGLAGYRSRKPIASAG